MAPTLRIIQRIDTWTDDDNFVAALKFYYSDGTPSGVFGDRSLVSTNPHTWIRRLGESITKLSVARFQGNLTGQLYAIRLETTKQPAYSPGTVQQNWPLKSIWKSSDHKTGDDIGDFIIDEYPIENNKLLVDIHAITAHAVGPVGTDVKQVAGYIASDPADSPGTKFVLNFDLEEAANFTYRGEYDGVITSPFFGEVIVTYRSFFEFDARPRFTGSVGSNHFHIEIDTDTELKVVVDGTVSTSSKKSVAISGEGTWA